MLSAEPSLTVHKSGQDADDYLRTLCCLLEEAGLNKHYPDPRRLMSLYRHMGRSLDVRLSNGLPCDKDVIRVITDAQMSERVLGEESRGQLLEQFQKSGSQAARRRLERWDYHQSLRDDPPPKAVDLRLSLMRVDPSTRTAHFTVTLDRFDLAEGLFARYTIVLAQTASRWKKQQVELVGDDLEYTQNFSNVIARFTGDEAEFAFLLLSDLPNIVVEEVVRCRVGPIWLPGGKGNPCGGCVLHLPMERAGRGVQREGCGDPLGRLYRDFLSTEAREPVEARARQLGYKVWKERKFVTTADSAPTLKAWLAEKGKACVIRTI